MKYGKNFHNIFAETVDNPIAAKYDFANGGIIYFRYDPA